MVPFMLLALLCSTLSSNLVGAAPPPPARSNSDMDLLSSILAANDVRANGNNPTPSPSPKPSIIDNYLRAFPADGVDLRKGPTVPSLGGSSSAAVNCREFVLNLADTLAKCNAVTQRDLNVGTNANAVTGFCRWEASASACWCPRPRSLCEDIKQCYWNKDPALSGNPQLTIAGGECISNAERFYNILSNLLLKRGKKDFAIRINYSSAPARGQLPTGPYGPAIIGGGSNPGMMPPGYGAPMGYPSMPPQYGLPTMPQYGPPPSMPGYGLPQGYGAPMLMPSSGAYPGYQ